MSFDLDDARRMEELFVTARDTAPIRQVRGEMNARANEWTRALDYLDELGHVGWTIELVGSLVPHMRFARPSQDMALAAQTVERVLHRDGGVAVQYSDPLSGRAVYVNFISAASPVVVEQ